MINGATILDCLRSAEERLVAAGIDTARLDAEILLSHVIGCRRMALYGMGDKVPDGETLSRFQALVDRRASKEPVAYILGEQEFWSLSFKVTPATLIPRPDTETLVEAVLSAIADKPGLRLLDLGTGSGCILLSLLSELEGATGTGVDINAAAAAVALENAARLRLSSRAKFLTSNWFECILKPDEGFDVIVSNPPYIPSADIAGLMPDVREFEPVGALDGGEDGLGPYRLIAAKAPDFLAEGGLLAVEVGIRQADDVARLFEQTGLIDIAIRKDLAGIDRVVIGKKS